MDFRESLEFLYGLQRFGIKLGLDNTRALLERAGHPERTFPAIHVAGTNGKGSVCAFLDAILRQAGYRVGLYTSPHLQSFTERIRIDGIPLDEEEVAALTAELRKEAQGIPATFFEFTTVLALLAFARHGVDIAILETGLGGRLDATNAVTPLVTVITPISPDHQEHLGATISAIAAEKAGIIKPGIPVVTGRQTPDALAVLLNRAKAVNAPMLCLDRDFSVASQESGLVFNSPDLLMHTGPPGLAGVHQHDNAALAVEAVLLLGKDGFEITTGQLRSGIETARWPGRLEWIDPERKVLLDGAHNAAGAQVLAAYLRTLPIDGLHWVAGIKSDKNFHDILEPLLSLTRSLYAVAPPTIPAVDPDLLAAHARSAGVPSSAFTTVAEALAAAHKKCGPREIILVAGSLFLVGAARDLLLDRETVR